MTQQYQIHQGDNLATLAQMADNSVDSVVTDPPYGIDFLGKEWDSDTGSLETYRECLRVLKPGGYILAFSAARTYHHLATTIEQAGFEIRDQLMWLYGSGFPKAQDLGRAIQKRQGVKKTKDRTLGASGGYKNNAVGGGLKQNTEVNTKINEIVPTSPEALQWSGWKTALKPAHEPIVMARKPFKGSCIDNVLANGVGALNIDATRVDNITEKEKNWTPQRQQAQSSINLGGAQPGDQQSMYNEAGRYPSNVIGEVEEEHQKYFYRPEADPETNGHDPIVMARKPFKGSCIDNVLANGVGALNIDATRIPTDDKMNGNRTNIVTAIGGSAPGERYAGDWKQDEAGRYPSNVIGEVGDYQKYFYSPKVSRSERHCGYLEDPAKPVKTGGNFGDALKGDDKMWGKHQTAESESTGIPTTMSMLDDMGGYPVDDQGNREGKPGKSVYLPGLGVIQVHSIKEHYSQWLKANNRTANVGNNHPTVKPVSLMRYLIKLVTPDNGVVLDPYTGSGSTGMAAVELGHQFIGCELDPEYVAIAERRIEAWNKKSPEEESFNNLFD